MKVSPNIGIINALIRITTGFTILAWSTAKLSKKPWRESYLLVAMVAGMKIGEGILRYCPLTALFEKSASTMEQKDVDIGEMIHAFSSKMSEGDKEESDKEDFPDLPYNPS
ncbi:YgaP family membrane protein [Bacillus sp. 2205SS5-2]|uniref:YgaP family membrane protein n=1 Tax=Bacillus sp. 2205SS5-2 TaxID=3109031 RepID=UPI0030063B8E